ncbi:MAG TPA: MarR family transcriptional regulator [Candidatus Cybelea sp.]|nr:MarR family transcriptional regulator [Candidatus Cybelea sp.]
MDLTRAMERYVVHWGEMGARWGVNRSVAQIHALLFLASRPLTAEEIAETLSIARSNVSTSLKELQGWGLANMVHVLGDRRDHFETEKDVWKIALTIVQQRKAREIDPTLGTLAQCVTEAKEDPATARDVVERMASVLNFLETVSVWYDQVKDLPPPVLMKLVKLGARVARFVGRRRS